MGAEWSATTIGSLLEDDGGEIKTGPFGTKLKASEYSDMGVPVVSVGEVQLGRIVLHDKTPKVGTDITDRMPEYVLREGDIVFGRKGAVERSARVVQKQDGWFLGSDGIRLRLPRFYNTKFIAYQFLTEAHKQWMIQHAAGTTMASLNEGIIRRIPIVLAPRSEQDAIAHILGTLDDKIELNRQMNTTLEVMAQALFKSWFVDFDPVIDNALLTGNPIPEPLQARAEMRKALGEQRKLLPAEIQRQFPSRFVFTEAMGWVPEGWRNMRADEVASISIGKTPPRKESQWFSDVTADSLVWVSIRDMGNSGVFIGDSSEYLTTESVQKFNVKIVPKDSVILSFKLTLGRVAIADTELTTNEAIAHFVSPRFGLNKEYLYLYLRSFDYGNLGSTSSIATAINSKIIKSMPVLVPNAGALKAFEEVARFWFSSICENISQTETLTKLRETLLPKLLSGQLRIPDAEAIVEQVAAG